jgi:hypothetical protein
MVFQLDREEPSRYSTEKEAKDFKTDYLVNAYF